MKIQFTKNCGNYQAGQILKMGRDKAEEYIRLGIAQLYPLPVEVPASKKTTRTYQRRKPTNG